ncbi:hypothetical protein G5B39_07630 [Rhodobacteraceae bacterium SC52]|nr:hypothetical protein G5B39_07630 [Rhodobacteraceae bacterium SC52]
MTDRAQKEVTRLKRSVWLLGAAGAFFCFSALIHLFATGGVRIIDIIVPLWALLFAGYFKRLRRAQARLEQTQ